MALNQKGKKIMMSMKKQYGKKKGEEVFYAMENSGKLKKVIKAKGGRDASKSDFNTPGSVNDSLLGTSDYQGDVGNFNKTTVSGSGDDKRFTKTVSQNFQKVKSDFSNLFKGNAPFATLNLVNNLIFEPLTKMNRTRRARGNMIIGGKKMPITRDYYRTTGKPLDVMSKEGIQYQKDAGLITDRKQTTGGGDGGAALCPDGTLPPCKPTVAKPTVAKPKTSDFFQNFKAYPLKSGGVSSGPPPKSGPNPQVPPVKLKKGKMTKSYKMSCPHRPDGIRGVGAAIRGHKFIGVK